MDGLETSLYNLYLGNTLVCQKQGVNKKECEARIEETIRRIQGIAEKNCKGNKICELSGLEWHIDNEEIEKLRDRLRKTYT